METNKKKSIIIEKFGSQSELAKYTGIEEAALSRIINGLRVATDHQKLLLKGALGVDNDFFRNEKEGSAQ